MKKKVEDVIVLMCIGEEQPTVVFLYSTCKVKFGKKLFNQPDFSILLCFLQICMFFFFISWGQKVWQDRIGKTLFSKQHKQLRIIKNLNMKKQKETGLLHTRSIKHTSTVYSSWYITQVKMALAQQKMDQKTENRTKYV